MPLGLIYHGGTKSQRTANAASRALRRRHGCCLSGFQATDTAPGGFAAAARLALYGVENKATKLETALQKSVCIRVHLWPSPGPKPGSNERGEHCTAARRRGRDHVSALIGVHPRTHALRPLQEDQNIQNQNSFGASAFPRSQQFRHANPCSHLNQGVEKVGRPSAANRPDVEAPGIRRKAGERGGAQA
jgi:hypothetical protein